MPSSASRPSLATAVLVTAIAVFWVYLAAVGLASPATSPRPRIFEDDELRAAAEKQDTLLLVIVGRVFEVTSGREFYGKTKEQSDDSYEGFANGTDNTRAFLTADFEKNATDDLSDLQPGECLGIDHWVSFYNNHKTYTFVGLHHGRFYDATGTPTEAYTAFRACVEDGMATRAEMHELATRATRCQEDTPTGEARFKTGAWKRYSCSGAELPRRVTLEAFAVSRCVCLSPASASEVEERMRRLAMEDDPAMPQLYPGCARDAEACAVRDS